MDLILVRHGQSQYNLDQTGGDDAPLTELGRVQARRAGAYLSSRYQLRTLYASTYIRARETAEIINVFVGADLRLEPDLREAEIEYGAGWRPFANPRDALVSHAAVEPRDVSDYYATFQARVIDSVLRILRDHQEGQIAIVSHGGTMGTIVRTLAGSHQFSVHSENTGMHVLHWQSNRWHVVALNRVEHLLSPQDLVAIPTDHEYSRE